MGRSFWYIGYRWIKTCKKVYIVYIYIIKCISKLKWEKLSVKIFIIVDKAVPNNWEVKVTTNVFMKILYENINTI